MHVSFSDLVWPDLLAKASTLFLTLPQFPKQHFPLHLLGLLYRSDNIQAPKQTPCFKSVVGFCVLCFFFNRKKIS